MTVTEPPVKVNTIAPGPCWTLLACAEIVPEPWASSVPVVADRMTTPETLAFQVSGCAPLLVSVNGTAAPLHASARLVGLTPSADVEEAPVVVGVDSETDVDVGVGPTVDAADT